MRVHWTQNAIGHLANIYEHIALNSPTYAKGMVDKIPIVQNKSPINRYPDTNCRNIRAKISAS